MAREWKVRPSSLYDIQDGFVAWQFDRAVYVFGSALQGELDVARREAKNKTQARTKQQTILSKWLNHERKFRDPSAGAPKQASEQKAPRTPASPVLSSEGTAPGEIVKL